MTNQEIQRLLDQAVVQLKLVDAKKVCADCKVAKDTSEYYVIRKTGRAKTYLYPRCKPCAIVLQRKRYWDDPDRARVTQKQVGKKYRDRLRAEALAGYGNECACCGQTQSEFLCFDHVHGGGAKHRRETGLRGQELYRWLRKNDFPLSFRVLCHNCNLSLGVYGYCPHERVRLEVVA